MRRFLLSMYIVNDDGFNKSASSLGLLVDIYPARSSSR